MTYEIHTSADNLANAYSIPLETPRGGLGYTPGIYLVSGVTTVLRSCTIRGAPLPARVPNCMQSLKDQGYVCRAPVGSGRKMVSDCRLLYMAGYTHTTSYPRGKKELAPPALVGNRRFRWAPKRDRPLAYCRGALTEPPLRQVPKQHRPFVIARGVLIDDRGSTLPRQVTFQARSTGVNPNKSLPRNPMCEIVRLVPTSHSKII